MGVRFLAVSQSIDTDESNPTARLLLHILASIAEFERELIRERVRAGIKSAKHSPESESLWDIESKVRRR
jgi:DNA invertase Pin-like site-specific DNA recombinase